MDLLKNLQQAHLDAIYTSKGILTAEKKLQSKGKKYTYKNLKDIIKAIDMYIHSSKKNGKFYDSYYEPLYDDKNHFIIAFHTGSMFKRLNEIAKLDNSFQFYIWNLPQKITNLLGLSYYPIDTINKYLTDEEKEEVERIKRYISKNYLTIQPDGSLVITDNNLFSKSNISKGTLYKATVLYRIINNKKLGKLFIKPEYYNKYIGFIYSDTYNDENEVKRWMVVNDLKSYTGSENKGFLIDFAFKIAEKSYYITINGKPLINISSIYDLFPNIKNEIKEKTFEKTEKINLSNKILELFFNKTDIYNIVKLSKPGFATTLILETNFPVYIKQGGKIEYKTIEENIVLAFLDKKIYEQGKTFDVIKQLINNSYIVSAVDIYDELYSNKGIKNIEKSILTLLKAPKEVKFKRILFLLKKIKKILELKEMQIKKDKILLEKLADKLVNDLNSITFNSPVLVALQELINKNIIPNLLFVDIITDIMGIDWDKNDKIVEYYKTITNKALEKVGGIDRFRIIGLGEYIYNNNIKTEEELNKHKKKFEEFEYLNKEDIENLRKYYEIYSKYKNKFISKIKDDNLLLVSLIENMKL